MTFNLADDPIFRDTWHDLEQMWLEGRIAAGDSRIYLGPKNHWRYYLSKNKRRMFVWTTRPDTNGDYWTTDYVRVKRTKDHESWKATKWVRCARRKTAKAKALRRYRRYHSMNVSGEVTE